MNCKPGDLAMVVRARDARNLGCIVRVIAVDVRPGPRDAFPPPFWYVEGKFHVAEQGKKWAADCQLRPIRDNDGEDEMLRLVGKPEGVTA